MKCSEEAWLPVKDGSVTLETGMQIRFGRSRYRVEEINLAPNSLPEAPTGEVSCSSSQIFENVCRICLSGSNLPQNPLITVCKCTGTMQWIHANCAEAFVLSKLKTSTSPTVESYMIQPVCCDLCLAELQLPLKDQSIEWAHSSSLKPAIPYLKLVRLGDSREFHYVHPGNGETVAVGRARTSDLKLPDASISRAHASLTRTDAGFEVRDENSKFGTLIKAQNVVSLPYGKEVMVQIRHSLVKFKAIRPWKLMKYCCCCCLKKPLQVAPVYDKCVTEPNTKRHEDLPLSSHFLFP